MSDSPQATDNTQEPTSGTTATSTPSYVDPRFKAADPYAYLPDVPTFPLSSADFASGDELPADLQGPDGVSPQLSWSDLPEGTKSLAVTVYDPDAPTVSGYWHWAVYNLPADLTELPKTPDPKTHHPSQKAPKRSKETQGNAGTTAQCLQKDTAHTATSMPSTPSTLTSSTSPRTQPRQFSGSTSTSTLSRAR